MKRTSLKPLSLSVRYRSFIADRDRALEVILNKYLDATASVVSMLFEQVKANVSALAAQGSLTPYAIHGADSQLFEHKINFLFKVSAAHADNLLRRMRVSVYTLAHVGEVEAIARATGKPRTADVSAHALSLVVRAESAAGGPTLERIQHTFNNLKRDVLASVEQSMIMEDSNEEAIERLRMAFPKGYKVTLPRRVLKSTKVKEARYALGRQGLAGSRSALMTGFIDDDAWEQMIDDYAADYIDPMATFGRGPKDSYQKPPESGEEQPSERYGWELENEMTHDFVMRVRDGQEDAANANGINDFQWIAIVDSKTDDCCLWRDGLTSTEIEQQLSEGKHKDDDCVADVITPPAHFNCRCTMAPMTDDMPEETPPDYGEFDEWLKS